MAHSSLFSRSTASQAIRFALVGVVATLIHYGLYYVLLEATAAPKAAYTVGYVVSFVINYYLTSFFTFKSRPSRANFIGMAGSHVVNYLLHIALFSLFLRFGVPEKLVPLPVYAIAVPVNFLLVRYVFKRP